MKDQNSAGAALAPLFVKLIAVSAVCTAPRWSELDLLGEHTSGLPPARQTDIISLFIRRHGSKLPLCQAEKWHFGALPSQPRIEKFVKVGHRVSSSRQRSWRRKGAVDQRDTEQSVVPTGRQNAPPSLCQGWVLDTAMWAVLRMSTKIRLSFICFGVCPHPAVYKLQHCVDSVMSDHKKPSLKLFSTSLEEDVCR